MLQVGFEVIYRSKYRFIYSEHIEHIRVTAGIDNVGLAGDYDGISRYIIECFTRST